MKDEAILPRNFRTTEDPFILSSKDVVPPTRVGFNHLRLSGSAQFSDQSFKVILEKIKSPKNLYIVDLRQECHGFINGDAVSWYGVRDWSNVGKSINEIEEEELALLSLAMQEKNVVIGKIEAKDDQGEKVPEISPMRVKVENVETESKLASRYRVNYVRVPISDHVKPSNDTVDRLVSFVKNLPEDHWLHIHCSAGVGRTTTVMAMIDMMKNAKQVSLKDIFDRQWLIGGRDLRKLTLTPWKISLIRERVQFLENFYKYCETNQDQFRTSWSLYLLINHHD
jgi:hypothetical protein